MAERREDEPEAPQGQGAYDRLIEEIRAGSLLPGTRLRETDLATRLGISRTPVREALRRLEADGLVSHLPRQGATLRSLSYSEVTELYEMRTVLEGTAARLAARAASDIEIDALSDLNAELAQTGPGEQARDLNRQFHLVLLDAAKNRFLLKSMSALRRTMMILGPTTLIAPERAQVAVEEHARVLDALRARDGVAAEAAMRAHIEAAHRVRLRGLRDRNREAEDDE